MHKVLLTTLATVMVTTAAARELPKPYAAMYNPEKYKIDFYSKEALEAVIIDCDNIYNDLCNGIRHAVSWPKELDISQAARESLIRAADKEHPGVWQNYQRCKFWCQQEQSEKQQTKINQYCPTPVGKPQEHTCQ